MPKLNGQRGFQLILLMNNESIKLYSSHFKKETAISKMNKLLKESNDVIFPVEYHNSKTKIFKVKYHIAIIRRKNELDGNSTMLKNDYGEYVEHIVEDNDEWIMYAKEPYYFEETFWVYGYNPKVRRKDFMFIYENLIKKYSKDKYEFMNIWLYKNKICFETYSHMDMVICKNPEDSLRLYNKLEEYCLKDKLKYLMFSGKKNSSDAIKKIMELTNWNWRKATRYNTRP